MMFDLKDHLLSQAAIGSRDNEAALTKGKLKQTLLLGTSEGVGLSFEKANKVCSGIDDIVGDLKSLHDEALRWREQVVELHRKQLNEWLFGRNIRHVYDAWKNHVDEVKASEELKHMEGEDDHLEKKIHLLLKQQESEFQHQVMELRAMQDAELREVERNEEVSARALQQATEARDTAMVQAGKQAQFIDGIRKQMNRYDSAGKDWSHRSHQSTALKSFNEDGGATKYSHLAMRLQQLLDSLDQAAKVWPFQNPRQSHPQSC